MDGDGKGAGHREIDRANTDGLPVDDLRSYWPTWSRSCNFRKMVFSYSYASRLSLVASSPPPEFHSAAIYSERSDRSLRTVALDNNPGPSSQVIVFLLFRDCLPRCDFPEWWSQGHISVPSLRMMMMLETTLSHEDRKYAGRNSVFKDGPSPP